MARAILILLLLMPACGEADEAQVRGLVEQAAAHLKAGRQQDAIRDLEHALRVKEELSTLLALAQLQAAAGQWQEAERHLARAKQLSPVSTQVQTGLADAATFRGRWDEARTLYEEIADRAPQDATPRLLLGALGDTPSTAEHALQALAAWRTRAKAEPATRELLVAEAMLERTLGMPPHAESPWVRARAVAAGDVERAVRMARIYLRREEWTAAQILLEGASDERPQKPELLLLAAAAIENEDVGAAQKAIARADKLGKAGSFGPGPAEEQVLRARIELATGRAAAARDRLQAALAKPSGLDEDARGRLLYWLGRSVLRLQSVADARKWFEAVSEASSAYPVAQLGLAELELAGGQPQAALARLETTAARKGPAGVHLLLARLQEDAGRPADAERVLRRALEQHPHAGSVWLALAKLLLRTSQPGPSGAALDQVLRDDPWNAEALGVRAQLAAREDKTQAIALYRKLLTAHPEHPAALNNLALLLSRSPESLDEALSLAERAQRARPEDPLIADTLGWIHHLRGEAALARPLLEKALAGSPRDPEVQYHAGAALLAGGDRGRGRALLQAALAHSADFDGADHARALLAGQN